MRAVLVMALAAVLMIGSTSAAGKNKSKPAPQQGQKPPVVFGTITALEKGSMTIKPEIPEPMHKRMEERGRELPQLPDSITVKLTGDTKWFFGGEKGSRDDFAVGDQVVVKIGAAKKGKAPIAQAVADPDSARKFITEKLRERRQGQGGRGEQGWGQGPGGGEQGWGQGPGGEQGWGQGPGGGQGPGDEGWGQGPGGMGPGGPGGPGGQQGQRRMRPAFGVITKITDDAVTIRPEVPDFIAERLEDRSVDLPKDLPESVTAAILEPTRFVVDGEVVEQNPFGKGDQVAVVIVMGREGKPVALAITDYATAKKRMEERMQGGGPNQDGSGQGKERPRARRRHQQ